MNGRRTLLVLALLAAPTASGAQVRALVVTGLGGEPAYSQRFAEQSARLVRALRERFGVPDSLVSWFGEDSTRRDPSYAGLSTRENVERIVHRMATTAAPDDRILLALIGHGSGSEGDTRLSLPGPDLTALDFRRLLGAFGDRPVVVLLLMSGGGDAVSVLSSPQRVVISATKTSYERNEVQFPAHFIRALAEDVADADKDGRVSMLEAFRYAARETKRGYDDTQRLQTEHAVLDDNGDGQATDAPTGRGEGAAARRFFIDARVRTARSEGNDATSALYAENDALNDRVEALKLQRAIMPPAAYETELERLLVALARNARELRRREGRP